MAKIKLKGHDSGTGILTVTAPNTSTDRTITLPDEDVTLGAATPSIDDNGNATAITIDSSENVGFGVTPEPHNADWTALDIGGMGTITGETAPAAGRQFTLNNNAYVNAAGYWVYKHSSDEAAQLQMFDGKFRFRTAPTGTADGNVTFTERLLLANDGNLTLNTGNLVIGTAGKGIDFSAHANHSGMSSEVLNDYEQGTWTPTTNGGSWNLIPSTATYTKIGNLVSLQFYFSISNGQSSRLEVGGMPYATTYNGYNNGSADTNTLGHVGTRTQSSASYFIVKRANNNSWVNSSEVNGGHMIGNIVYHV